MADPVEEGGSTQMEDEIYGLDLPSVAHAEAIASVVYRLSELMFGSLLASYVLGFIGFSAPHTAALFSGGDLRTLYPEVLTYLFISMTFAYLTAGLYISYHVGILTMPHLPFSKLRWDFLIALLHSVLFGVSMLLPLWLPLCVGIVLVAALLRQSVECRALVEAVRLNLLEGIREEISRPPLPQHPNARKKKEQLRLDLQEFKKFFYRELQAAGSLNAWWKVSRWTVAGTVLLIVLGGAIVICHVYGLFPLNLRGVDKYVPVLTGLVFLSIMLAVHRVLGHRADFMYRKEEKPKVNGQFRSFIDRLADGLRVDVK